MSILDNGQAGTQSVEQPDAQTSAEDLVDLLSEPEDGEQAEDVAKGDAPGDDEIPADDDGETPKEDAETPKAKLSDDQQIDLENGQKATIGELKQTFATFTRKTQELAEHGRAVLAEAREALATRAEEHAQQLHLSMQQVQQLVAPGFDDSMMARLAYEDPAQYQQVRARLDMVQRHFQGVQQQVAAQLQEAQRQREMAQQESQNAQRELLQTEGAKLAGQKWWNDDFRNKAVAFAKKHGVPEQLARSVSYAGFVEITRKAMLYDEAQARAKAGKQPPEPAKTAPGASPARGSLTRTKALEGLYSSAVKANDKQALGKYLDNVL